MHLRLINHNFQYGAEAKHKEKVKLKETEMLNRVPFLPTLLILGFIVSCNSRTENTAETTPGLEKNTPLGQASVVDNESEDDILKVAMGSKDHTTLVAAVQAAHIEHILSNAGPLTVFCSCKCCIRCPSTGDG